MRRPILPPSLLLVSLCLFLACQKETIVVSDNTPPFVGNVSTTKIENYVNRIFIDLLGREPVKAEMQREVKALREASLSSEAREAVITQLQTGTDFINGDTSYRRAYFRQLYLLAKIRCIEGASDRQIEAFRGAADSQVDINRLDSVLTIQQDLMEDRIQYHEAFGRMIYNLVYDEINMNTFNFVNASFDNLLWRYPTKAEFSAAFDMVENNRSNSLFGKTGQNKGDYVRIIISSREMFEGMIIWAYRQLLARRPTTEETVALLEEYYQSHDFSKVQRQIMVTNEYANF